MRYFINKGGSSAGLATRYSIYRYTNNKNQNVCTHNTTRK